MTTTRSLASRHAWLCSLGLAAVVGACTTDPQSSSDTDTDTDDGVGILSIGDESSSDDGSTTSDDDSSSTEAIRSCGDVDLEVLAVAPRIMLVLDKSHSMVTSTWDHDGDPSTAATTRWWSLHETVADLVADADPSLELGAVMFPSRALTDNDAATACDVPAAPDVAIAADNGQAILDAMPSADSLEIFGGTPTAAGITTAAAALREQAGDAPRAMVLVTDGAANCSADAAPGEIFSLYDENLAPLVASIADEGIPTYVVGIDIVDGWVTTPQANPHDRLAEVAQAGGAVNAGDEPFYDTRDQAQLYDALGSITARVQCTVDLDDLPSVADRVHLGIDEAALDYSPACDTTGWRYADDGAVELCAAACDDFVAGGTLHVSYDCVPEG